MTSSSVDLHSTDSETSVTALLSSTDTTLTGKVTILPVSMAVFRSSVSCAEADRAGSRGGPLRTPSQVWRRDTYLRGRGQGAVLRDGFPSTLNNIRGVFMVAFLVPQKNNRNLIVFAEPRTSGVLGVSNRRTLRLVRAGRPCGRWRGTPPRMPVFKAPEPGTASPAW